MHGFNVIFSSLFVFVLMLLDGVLCYLMDICDTYMKRVINNADKVESEDKE